ncbi:hypothetical protein NX722_03025 [Endozoicomonas gorgoniicola]|uniref:Uncharacterized protein n=1 Tax=Endozoicomonas gorgoniicola TaxID=1234144 RepID=A0ABT3MQH5_9GAMM|nr:hypothetical protein [Endozoicomonas gorgoniicola]MCW7551633.1 hypothetical protein [Endozoicomonas gorgoniicola]
MTDKFFQNKNYQKGINDFLDVVIRYAKDHEDQQERINVVSVVLTSMLKAPNDWDKYCQFNVDMIGDNFIESMREFKSNEAEYFLNVYVDCYRFLSEISFSMPNAMALT